VAARSAESSPDHRVPPATSDPSHTVHAASYRGRPRVLNIVLGALMIGTAVVLFVAEKRRPLRSRTQAEPARTLRNLIMGATSLGVVGLLQAPLVEPLAERVLKRRLGFAQQLPAPAWARDAAAFLLLDYTIYLWHVLTHKIPFLWRFHLVHHIDMDLDTTTALRFHALDMALSIPWRAAQVRLCGASPRALRLWQAFFFVSVLFHHSNLRLPLSLERALVRVFTTPRLHGIHHSAVRDETDSNWSSGLSIWDWLHGTVRTNVPQDAVTLGVPGYRDARDLTLGRLLALPFIAQRDAWLTRDGQRVERAPGTLDSGIFPS
jgi:sterol desaturase/sphingolipid hydroxylase (fatty acid hydroxylase superfamily)